MGVGAVARRAFHGSGSSRGRVNTMSSAQQSVSWSRSGGGGGGGGGGGASWNSILTQYATTARPQSQIPKDAYLRSDEHTLVIYDGFPKAKYHFLVLPRIPFKLEGTGPVGATIAPPPKLSLAGGKLTQGTSAKGQSVPNAHLKSIRSLLASPYAAVVLQKLREQSGEVVKLIQEEMRHCPLLSSAGEQTCGVSWGVRVGFHAVPSMDTVHLHVLSDDFVSERLKHKKHYQSFHPTAGFWLDLDAVEALVQQGKKALPYSDAQYEAILKQPMVSHRDGQQYATFPKLRDHLHQAWKDDVKARQTITNGGD